MPLYVLTYLVVPYNKKEMSSSLLQYAHRLSKYLLMLFFYLLKSIKFTFFAGNHCLAEPLSSTSKSPKNSN